MPLLTNQNSNLVAVKQTKYSVGVLEIEHNPVSIAIERAVTCVRLWDQSYVYEKYSI